MRRHIGLLVSAGLMIACTGPNDSAASGTQPPGQAKPDKSADEAALRSIYQSMPQQLTSGNAAAISALFADDGSEIMSGMPPAKGPEAVQKTMTAALAAMKDPKVSMGAVNVTIAEAGDLAVVTAPYQLSGTDPKGKAVNDHGTSMTVFKKVNGQWKILYDTNISEVAQ